MRELRRLHVALIEVFERFGYGEVATPAIEYDEVLGRGDGRATGSGYRFFDESGDLLALRSEMTVPIARLAATRFADAEGPVRLCYLASAFRAVRPQRGQMREFTQAGVELIGVPAPQGTAEVIEVLEAALDAAGLDRAVIGLGDADLYRQLLDELGVDGEARDSILERLATHDLVGLEAELSAVVDDEQCADLRRPLAAARRPRGARRRPRPRRRRRSSGRSRGSARPTRSSSAAAPPTGSRSTSACCATSAITAARSSRSTTRRSATSSAAAAATTACCGASALDRPRPASPSIWSASTSPRWKRSRAARSRS